MNRVLILGAGGLLGSRLQGKFDTAACEIYTQSLVSKAQFNLDLTFAQNAVDLVSQVEPDVIVNLVALTSVDECERDVRKAYLYNVRVVENIVSASSRLRNRAYIVQVSTDQVYDGPGLKVEDETCIRNNYAMTKYAGELALGRTRGVVLRTNFFGRSFAKGRSSFTDWIYRESVTRSPITLFDDVLFNPLSIETLGGLIVLVSQQQPTGVYNVGSRYGMSKADFGFLFAREANLSIENFHRSGIGDSTRVLAYRPRDMRMAVTKFEHDLGLVLPRLEDEIHHVASEYLS